MVRGSGRSLSPPQLSPQQQRNLSRLSVVLLLLYIFHFLYLLFCCSSSAGSSHIPAAHFNQAVITVRGSLFHSAHCYTPHPPPAAVACVQLLLCCAAVLLLSHQQQRCNPPVVVGADMGRAMALTGLLLLASGRSYSFGKKTQLLHPPQFIVLEKRKKTSSIC